MEKQNGKLQNQISSTSIAKSVALSATIALSIAIGLVLRSQVTNVGLFAQLESIRNEISSVLFLSAHGRTTRTANIDKSLENSRKKNVRYLAEVIGEKYQIDPLLLWSVVAVESNFNPHAVSHRGALGLMQLMPATAKEMKVSRPLSAYDNMEGGAKYLKWLIKRYNGNIKFALAAYNAGIRSIDKYKSIPPFAETQRYVTRVIAIYTAERANKTIAS